MAQKKRKMRKAERVKTLQALPAELKFVMALLKLLETYEIEIGKASELADLVWALRGPYARS